MMNLRTLFAALLVVGLSGCGAEEQAENTAVEDVDPMMAPVEGDTGSAEGPAEMRVNTAEARARLVSSEGRQVGEATFTEVPGGVQIRVQVNGLPEGTHGIHIHETGSCQTPEFQSAGGHFNPGGTDHGFDDPQGPHAGDLRNLEVGPNGRGQAEYVNDRVTLGTGERSLFGTDGSALVIHAGPDDYVTDPSGDSGARIACGVIAAG